MFGNVGPGSSETKQGSARQNRPDIPAQSQTRRAPQGNQPGKNHEDQQGIHPQVGRTDQELLSDSR
jgi:hypothetical protein